MSPRAFWHSGWVSGSPTLPKVLMQGLLFFQVQINRLWWFLMFLESRSRISRSSIPTLSCLGITQYDGLVLFRADVVLACLALNAGLKCVFTYSLNCHMLRRYHSVMSYNWQKWQGRCGTTVLEIVNNTVYKDKNFLLDITVRVLHWDLGLGKEIIETGIYSRYSEANPFPLAKGKSWSFMTKSDLKRYYISDKYILYEEW